MKFAYLIMAHDNPSQLITLLKMIDYVENDIYLHIDKKSDSIACNMIKECMKNASIHIYKKYNIKWAGMSQTRCQLFLLSEAVKIQHDYYHLLSGHDLPIKSHKEIQLFFKKNEGKEFVHFESDDFCEKDNCKYFNFGNSIFTRFLINIQKSIGINRHLYCGSNWFSITHTLAIDYCNHIDEVLRLVKYTISSDEYVLQSFIRLISHNHYDLYKHTNNPYDYSATVRLIDWHRGVPYVWRKADFKEIAESDRMFARKFDEKIDLDIICMVEEMVCEQDKKIGQP